MSKDSDNLLNIKNIDDKFKINNDNNTDRILTGRQKNPIINNRVYSPNENYIINTIYKYNINRKYKKLNILFYAYHFIIKWWF